MENSENMEIYLDCQPLRSYDEMVGEMALSMPKNYIVLSNSGLTWEIIVEIIKTPIKD